MMIHGQMFIEMARFEQNIIPNESTPFRLIFIDVFYRALHYIKAFEIFKQSDRMCKW